MSSKRRSDIWHSLRTQIVFSTVFFTMFLSLLLGIILFSISDRYVRDTTIQSSEFNLSLVASTIDRSLDDADSLLSWCGTDSSLRRYLSKSDITGAQLLSAYNAASDKYISALSSRSIIRFLITDEKTRYLQFGSALTTSAAMSHTTLQQFPYIGDKHANEWVDIFSDPLLPSRSECLVASRPIEQGVSHEHIGTAYIGLSLSVITDPLSGYVLDEGSSLYWIMGEQLWQINGTALDAVNFASLDWQEYTKTKPAQSTTKLYMPAKGGGIVVVVPLSKSGLYLAQSISEHTFLVQRRLYVWLIILGILFIQFTSLLLLRWLNHRVTKPIMQLQKRIQSIGGGDFSADPTIEWNNELGDVGRGINELSHNVDHLMTSRLEDQRQNQELEYRMLQNEINPHFIYNTLNSIRWMATIQHTPGIAEMVTALSRLLKSVSKGTEKLVPLQDELALLNDYFTIQQYRYGGDIYMDVSYIEDEKICAECLIPRFTLQPLAENAIFHGLEPKGGAGNVMLDIRSDGGDVLVKMTDDGIGMPPDKAAHALDEPTGENVASKFRHVGLWNVHRRLQYSFGKPYGLTIESEEDVGTVVTIRLPYQKKEDNAP